MSSPNAFPITDPRKRRKQILDLALPIIGAMASQNVLNLVDTAMVGRFGDASLAAVGLGSMMNFLASSVILGLSAGVQTMAARREGEGKQGETAIVLNGGLALAATLGVPWALLLVWLTPKIFPLFNDDPNVLAIGVPYLQARLLAMPAMGMNFAFRGYWNAVSRSGLYFRTLLGMHALNITLNWVLIYGHLGAPRLGAVGAGIANATAMYFGMLNYMLLGWAHARSQGFLRHLPDKKSAAVMIRLSVPAAVQQVFFAGGMTAFLAIVGRVGTKELAATQVLTSVFLVGILPGLGFGMAAASLVGQALGRGDPVDARHYGWDVVRIASCVVAVISLPGIVLPRTILNFFVHDAVTIDLAVLPLRLVAVFLATDSIGLVLMNALIGAGDTRRTMVVSVALQWCLFLPIAFLVGPIFGLGLTAIWSANILYRQTQSGVFSWLWQRGSWSRIEV